MQLNLSRIVLEMQHLINLRRNPLPQKAKPDYRKCVVGVVEVVLTPENSFHAVPTHDC